MTHTPKTLCVVAGRSGGHIIPGLTKAHQDMKAGLYDRVILCTINTKLDHAIARKASWLTHHQALSLDNIPWKNPFKWPLFIVQFVRSFFQSLSLLRTYKPQAILSMGGYVSVTVCLAAKITGTPVELFELNAVPGSATTFLARFAKTIHVCFEQAKKNLPARKCILSPYPIRFSEQAKSLSPATIRTQLGLAAEKKTVLIIGGSQGSVFVNQLIKQWLDLNPHIHALIQVIHQTGSSDTTNWRALYATHEIPAITFAYNDDMAPYYQAADIIICRAGAGSLFEIAFFEKEALVIPLQIRSTEHQKDNALAMAHMHPNLFTILLENDIKKNNTLFFSAINKAIYHLPTGGSKQLKEHPSRASG